MEPSLSRPAWALGQGCAPGPGPGREQEGFRAARIVSLEPTLPSAPAPAPRPSTWPFSPPNGSSVGQCLGVFRTERQLQSLV